MIWTDEADQLLLDGLKAGRTYTELGLQFGVTRNAIAGRAFRVRGPQTPRGAIPFMKLTTRNCHYPLENHLFCGLAAQGGGSYCPEHARRCFRPSNSKVLKLATAYRY